MSNETEGEGAPATDGKTRVAIAKRLWINDAGQEVEAVEDATGVSYEFMGRTKDGITVQPDGEAFTIYFRDMPAPMLKMLAGFGAHTLMGNVTNTWLGEKSPDKAPKAAAAVAERFDLLKTGQWVDRTGGVGARVDIPTLANAWTNVYVAAGKTPPYTVDVLAEKLTDNGELVKQLRRDPKIVAEYAKLRGAPTTDAVDLMANI